MSGPNVRKPKIYPKNGKKYAYLGVLGGGCSGFQYEWSMTDETDKGTLIEDILVLDKTAELFVIGCTGFT